MCSFIFFDKKRQYLELNDSNEDTTNTNYWIIEWYTPLLHRPLCYNYQHPSHMQIVLQSRCNFSQSTFCVASKKSCFWRIKISYWLLSHDIGIGSEFCPAWNYCNCSNIYDQDKYLILFDIWRKLFSVQTIAFAFCYFCKLEDLIYKNLH